MTPLLATGVSDSTCLIGLERIGKLDLLPGLVRRVLIPGAVRDEIGGKITAVWLLERAITNALLALVIGAQVDRGEAEAIVLATEMPGAVLLIDDKKARRLAAQMGLPILGTVGLILRAKRNGLIAQCRPLLDDLRSVGFRLSPELYNEALAVAGEGASD